MKCQKAEKLILLQDSGEIRSNEERTLETHLNGCKPCSRFRHTLLESHTVYENLEEPSIKAVQNVLREARVQAPAHKTVKIFGLKPALAMAASAVIGLGLFLSTFSPDKVGMELVVSEADMLDAGDQIVSVLYDGMTEDDLAFNFLMTYEDTYAAL
jgi:hypothetical protein